MENKTNTCHNLVFISHRVQFNLYKFFEKKKKTEYYIKALDTWLPEPMIPAK